MLLFWHHLIKVVKDYFQVPEKEKRPRGRPVVNSTSINLRLPPDLLDWLDAERGKMAPAPSRPEMVRIYLEEQRSKVIVKV
ncbi:MAG: hypothetical protein FJX25_06340 [Alphaproteobacteria bacterium]|nr:hypothetical protein [Alphaproteobacteria bacterium]